MVKPKGREEAEILLRKRQRLLCAAFGAIAGVSYGLVCLFRENGFERFEEAPSYTAVVLLFLFAGAAVVLCLSLYEPKKDGQIRRVLIAAVPFCLLYLALIPPMSAPDERKHFDTAYLLAERILGIEEPADPTRLLMRPEDENRWAIETYVKEPRDWDRFAALTLRTVSEENASFSVTHTSQAQTINVANLPSALFMAMGFRLKLSFGALALFATLPNVMIFLAACAYAVKKAPFGQEVFASAALLPICLQQACSLSYDSVLISAAFVATALGLKWGGEKPEENASCPEAAANARRYHEKDSSLADSGRLDVFDGTVKTTRKREAGRFRVACEILVWLLCAFVLVTVKSGVCAPILLTAFGAFGGWHVTGKKKGVAVGLGLALAAVIFGLFFLSGGADRVSEQLFVTPFLYNVEDYGVAPVWYLTHPLVTLSMAFRTLVSQGGELLRQTFGGSLGWLHMNAPLPLTLGIGVCFAAQAIRRPQDPMLTRPRRLLYALAAILPFLLTAAAMLFYYTPVGSDQIYGLQGRYLLPVLPLLGAAFGFWKKPVQTGAISREMLFSVSVWLGWLSAIASVTALI